MSPDTPTVPAGKPEASNFFQKAGELLLEAKDAPEGGRPNAAGLLAIHAGMSACDALTAHFLGVRSKSPRHHDVLNLIAKLPSEKKEAIAKQLRRLLDAKNTVEYDDQVMTEGDEDDMVEAAERILGAARTLIK